VSHSVADARYFGNPTFAVRHAELRTFVAKFCPTVEQTVERQSKFELVRLQFQQLDYFVAQLPNFVVIGSKL
jgi:hypothetical protein